MSKDKHYFFRGQAFYELAQLFAKPYIQTSASSDLGILLRLKSDINQPAVRSSVDSTYKQIISDLKNAVLILPLHPLYKTRPSKPAAYGLLARVYLSMQDYANARTYADSCLQLYNTLIDYNTLDTTSYNPLAMFNTEVIFHSLMFPRSIILAPSARIDSSLYMTYDKNDLRKSVFYKPTDTNAYGFYGSYSGDYNLFNGLATDELYFIRAECLARLNEVNDAMQDLNTILLKRWKAGSFIPYTVTSQADALNIILQERRKELVFRGLRWTDLRRLNIEPQFAKTIIRKINGNSYTMNPNDPKYVLLIPRQVINFSHIAQNPR